MKILKIVTGPDLYITSRSTYYFQYCLHMPQIYSWHADQEGNSVQIDVELVVYTFEANQLHLVLVATVSSVRNP